MDVISSRAVPWRTPGICPIALTEKLRAIRELRLPEQAQDLAGNPRLLEMMWFIQWRSHQPGGLDKFVQELLLEFPERMRSPAMRAVPWPRSGHYTLEECVQLWGSLPKNRRTMADRLAEERASGREQTSPSEMLGGFKTDGSATMLLSCAKDIAYLLRGDLSELRKIDLATHRNAARLVETLTPGFFWNECVEEAFKSLAGRLARICVEPGQGFSTSDVWYFDDLAGALIEMMDRHAARERQSIAKTTVSEMIMDRFEFAVEMRASVLIAGDARLGKSVTFEAACRMRPGRARLVTVPEGVGVRELVEKHAEAIYLAMPAGTTLREHNAAVAMVVRQSGLFFSYDEFHFAIPQKPPRNGSPPRMDWIRANVVDMKRGAAFSTTRQAYGTSMSEFLKQTKWAVEQWAGRLDSLRCFGSDPGDTQTPVFSREDILAIATHKFPEIAAEVLEYIAIAALGASAAPQVLESLLKAATWSAMKAGRSKPNTRDAEGAIAEWKESVRHESFEVGVPDAMEIKGSPTLCDARSEPAALLPRGGRPPAIDFPSKRALSPTPDSRALETA
jgi:hypothetical protein